VKPTFCHVTFLASETDVQYWRALSLEELIYLRHHMTSIEQPLQRKAGKLEKMGIKKEQDWAN